MTDERRPYAALVLELENNAAFYQRLSKSKEQFDPEGDADQARLYREAADAIAALTRELEEALGALAVFAECAKELEGSEDVPRAPDGEWAKFRLLTDDYRRAAEVHARLSSADGAKE